MNDPSADPGVIPRWQCPACGDSKNSYGQPFYSARAVSLHVAGKIRFADHAHHKWATGQIGQALDDPETRRSINTLGDALLQFVVDANHSRREQLDRQFEAWLKRRQAVDDPSTQAYGLVQEIENTLHKFVLKVLMESFGEGEDNWWAQGVPLKIRVQCQARREEDERRDEPYDYVDVIDLKAIVESHWRIFLPYFQEHDTLKSTFQGDMVQFNNARRRVAHTIRARVTEEELSFLTQFRDFVRVLAR